MSKPYLDAYQGLRHLLQRDRRYKRQAYDFIVEALHYAQEQLGLGENHLAWSHHGPREAPVVERHVNGRELCCAIREYALEQYGLMAYYVLGEWGISCTRDFGEIVFNLIDLGRMKKTKQDCREDFEEVFDFDEALRQRFEFILFRPCNGADP